MVLNDALLIQILRHAEEHADGRRPIPEPRFEEYNIQYVRHHIDLCHQAGYLKIHRSGKRLKILELTWGGHMKIRKSLDG